MVPVPVTICVEAKQADPRDVGQPLVTKTAGLLPLLLRTTFTHFVAGAVYAYT